MDPSGPCPRCGMVSNFSLVNQLDLTKLVVVENVSSASETMFVLTCMGCGESTVVVVDLVGDGLHWYPAPGAGHMDPAVDAQVASAYDEGMRCLAIGANRAAAVMFRSALHLFVKDKGSDKAKGERHLKTALKYMKDDGALHASLSDWAAHWGSRALIPRTMTT